MAQHIVIVSSVVDNTIKDYFKDIDITLFNDVRDVHDFIEHTPIRCTKFIVTSEITDKATTSSLGSIADLTNPDNKFFINEEFVFVAPEGSPSLDVLTFLQESETPGMTTVRIIKGALTRDFITTIIRGTYRDGGKAHRVEVERKRRDKVIREEMQRRQTEQNEGLGYQIVQTEEDSLSELPDEPISSYTPPKLQTIAKTIQIVGGAGRGKTTFLILLAQYIAKFGKVVIVENDFDFFSLSNALALTSIDYLRVTVEELYNDPGKAASKIMSSSENLVAIVGESRMRNRHYNKSFVTRMCFSLLTNYCEFMLLESNIQDMLPATKSVMILNNELIPILQDVTTIPYHASTFDFVALSKSSLKQGQLTSSQEITRLVSELLNIVVQNPIPIYRIESYELGDTVYDLHRYM